MKESKFEMLENITVRATSWIGSIPSLIVHTLIFLSCFIAILSGARADTVMLVLTTIVSLEAIYLSIFIQMSVNRAEKNIEEIQEDVEEIQEDIEDIEEEIDDIQEDIEDIAEDVEDIQEDMEEIAEDVEGIEKDLVEVSEDIDEIQEDIEEMEEDESNTIIHKTNETRLTDIEMKLEKLIGLLEKKEDK